MTQLSVFILLLYQLENYLHFQIIRAIALGSLNLPETRYGD